MKATEEAVLDHNKCRQPESGLGRGEGGRRCNLRNLAKYLSLRLSDQNVYISYSPHACCMPRSSHPNWLNRPNIIR
jgi:hypothetical protein